MKTLDIQTKEQFTGLINEAVRALIAEDPQLIINALAGNAEGTRAALEKSGIIIGDAVAGSAARVVAGAYRRSEDAQPIRGFGARIRRVAQHQTYTDPVTGRTRRNYLAGSVGEQADAWMRAFLSKDGIDSVTGKSQRALAGEMNAATRAPATPLTGEPGTAGSILVPTQVAAQIYEEMVERFVLRDRVDVFVSAAPLRIPRRTSRVTVSRGAPATNLGEKDFTGTLGDVTLSPERVGALTYVDPALALAAAVGPTQWVIGQIAEAMALDVQRCIVAGEQAVREPRGINTLPLAGGNLWDRAKTAAYTATDNATKRDSFRKLYYALAQAHRESPRTLWIVNNDVMQVMASLNDTNQRPFEEATGGNPTRFLGKEVVETSALVTAANTASALIADMAQYAWLESPDGLRIEQTTVGGEAWVSDTIGVKAVQSIDGAPVIPPAFGSIPVTGLP